MLCGQTLRMCVTALYYRPMKLHDQIQKKKKNMTGLLRMVTVKRKYLTVGGYCITSCFNFFEKSLSHCLKFIIRINIY